MSDDPLAAFKQYELQKRQDQMARIQHLSDEQERKKKEVESQQSLRDQARIESERRQSEERRLTERQSIEKRRLADEAHAVLLAQSAEELRRTNRQKEEAQRLALEKIQAIQEVREKGSPIERIFFDAWREAYPDTVLKRQHQIGKYFVDFAHIDTQIAIELDGHEFHSSRKDRTKDYQRQRYIEDQGWSFVRFTGSEVFHDVASCVETVAHRIQQGR